jgi:UDP-glucose 4-epimerase
VDAEIVEGSILDEAILIRVLKGIDSVVHLGAIPSVPRSLIDPKASHNANATGTLYVLEAARKVGIEHVIVASSSSVYGANLVLPKGEFDWTRPMSPYAVSKQATEGYALAYQSCYGMQTLAFRFFNVYGPRQLPDHAYAAVIPRFLQSALKGHPVNIEGDGKQSRDFTFIDSLCEIMYSAIERRVTYPGPVNLAFGTRTSILELVDVIEDVVGSSVERNFVSPRPGDVHASQADPRVLLELFPHVEPTTLRVGLRATAEWLHEIYHKEYNQR